MSKLKPKIEASSIEEFKEISDAINTLPEEIFCQIEKADKGLIGITCEIRCNFGNKEQRILLPNYTTQIKNFGDYIGIYSGNFFFKIEGGLQKSNLEYVFIDCTK